MQLKTRSISFENTLKPYPVSNAIDVDKRFYSMAGRDLRRQAGKHPVTARPSRRVASSRLWCEELESRQMLSIANPFASLISYRVSDSSQVVCAAQYDSQSRVASGWEEAIEIR